MNKEIEILSKENDKIREEINKIIGINYPLWDKINLLIKNEIEQENLCGE